MADIESVSKFVSKLVMHFSPPKRAEGDEAKWIASLAHALRDYVPSELERAAEEIINTRQQRFFPLPKECLEACAHARRMMRIRASFEEQQAKEAKGEPIHEPGREMRYREDAAWRAKQHRKGITLRSDIEKRADWWNWGPPSAETVRVLKERNRGQ